MVHIPLELLEQIERNNVVLMLGHDVNVGEPGEPGVPTRAELAQELADRSGYPERDLNFARVAQYYEFEFGRHALIDYIRGQWEDSKERRQDSVAAPLAAHRILATLPFRVIVTTCCDHRLEQAFLEAGCPFAKVVRNADVAYEDEDKLLLVKMYGDLSDPDSLVLTEMDHRRFLSQVLSISDVLNRLIASRTLLLLGYDLDDDNFKDLYDRVTRRLDRHVRRSYAFCRDAPPYAVKWWEKQNQVRVVQVEPTAFLRNLDHRLRERRAEPSKPAPGMARPAEKPAGPVPRRPYKFLNAFQEQDAAIFFGRGREKLKLLSKLISYRLVLLYGKSGVGKTSLVKAGMIPALVASGYHPVYARTLTDPRAAITRALNATLEAPLPEQPTLHAYLQRAGQATESVVVLFVDQFEELFTQVDPETRAAFVEDLGVVYADDDLQVKVVLSFREDFLAELHVFADDIPGIFDNYFRLERLTLEQAKEAITGPAELCGFSYEPGLIDRLLADLGGDEVDPPQLQIVCDSLYEALGPNERLITNRHYELLGGASTILAGYLDQVLKRYVSEQRAVVQELLKAFVTSADTEAVLTVEALARRTGLPVAQAQKMLDELLRARLVRRAESETQYELAHEYLVGRIASWISDQERAHQRAREMLEHGLDKWKRFGLRLYRDELALINAHRDALDLDEEAVDLLVRSAVWSGLATDYWLERATPQLRMMVLREAAEVEDAVHRQRAAALIGRFAVLDLKKVLADLMLADPEPAVRREAALSLVHLDRDYFVSCIEAGLDGPPERRHPALEAVASVQDAGSEVMGSDRLARFNLRWRLRRLRLGRNRAQRNIMALFAAVGGAFGAAVGGLAGGMFSVAPEILPFATLLAATTGLVIGFGTGFGLGTVEAMGERRISLFYVASAALGAGIPGMVFGGGDLEPSRALLGAAMILIGGMITGGSLAVIINLTRSVAPPARRLAVRFVSGAFVGVMLGTVFALGTHAGAVCVQAAHGAAVPLGAPYGFGLGLLMPSCIAGGIEFAERRLQQANGPDEAAQDVESI